MNFQVYSINRFDIPDDFLKHAPPNRKMHLESFKLDQGIIRGLAGLAWPRRLWCTDLCRRNMSSLKVFIVENARRGMPFFDGKENRIDGSARRLNHMAAIGESTPGREILWSRHSPFNRLQGRVSTITSRQ